MAKKSTSMEKPARALGHRFEDVELLRDALTHSSFANERPDEAPANNERLEFLGDAVLELSVSRILWDRFPDATEGELTRRRADLVCEEELSDLARSLKLGDALRLGRGEARTGGRNNPRLLASALEACVAAVYLDGGVEAAMEVCRKLYERRVHDEPPGSRDYKTRVQELLQRGGRKPPRYRVVESSGPAHARQFVVEATIAGGERARAVGEGHSKSEAEQEAARLLLRELEPAARAGSKKNTRSGSSRVRATGRSRKRR
jgi:ribonuclease-3